MRFENSVSQIQSRKKFHFTLTFGNAYYFRVIDTPKKLVSDYFRHTCVMINKSCPFFHLYRCKCPRSAEQIYV